MDKNLVTAARYEGAAAILRRKLDDWPQGRSATGWYMDDNNALLFAVEILEREAAAARITESLAKDGEGHAQDCAARSGYRCDCIRKVAPQFPV